MFLKNRDLASSDPAPPVRPPLPDHKRVASGGAQEPTQVTSPKQLQRQSDRPGLKKFEQPKQKPAERRPGRSVARELIDELIEHRQSPPQPSEGTLFIAQLGVVKNLNRLAMDATDYNDVDPEEIFLLGDKIGEGAYGAVFKASWRDTDDNTERPAAVAVKILPFLTEESKRAVQKELDVLKKAQHPHLVSYFGSYLKDTYLWVTMDFCDVGSVADANALLRRYAPVPGGAPFAPRSSSEMASAGNPLSEKTIAAVLYHTVKGLSFLHSDAVRVIHRDMKGNNLLIASPGIVKIADFGISFQQTGSRTKAATLIGTPLFMAPEILDGEKYSTSADIWSLGITAVELAEGFPPYFKEHPMRALFLLSSATPPTLSNPAQWSQEFVSFVAACLKKAPTERASAEALIRHPFLQQVADEHITLVKAYVDRILDLKKALIERREQEAAEFARPNEPVFAFPDTLSTTDGSVMVNMVQEVRRYSAPPEEYTTEKILSAEEIQQSAENLSASSGVPKVPRDKKPKAHFERSSSLAMFDSLSRGVKIMLEDDKMKSMLESSAQAQDDTSSNESEDEASESDEEAHNNPQKPSGTTIFFQEMREGAERPQLPTKPKKRKSSQDRGRPKRSQSKKKKQVESQSFIDSPTASLDISPLLQRSASVPLARRKKQLEEEGAKGMAETVADVKKLDSFDQYLGMSVMELIIEIETWRAKCEQKEVQYQQLLSAQQNAEQ